MIRVGRLYLVGLFLIGALSAAAGADWIRKGKIVFRSEDASGVETVARLDQSDPLFLPLAATWFQLGGGVATLVLVSLFVKERAVERWAGYACIAMIFLAVATALVSYRIRDDANESRRDQPTKNERSRLRLNVPRAERAGA